MDWTPAVEGSAGREAAIAAIEQLSCPACLLDGRGEPERINAAWRRLAGLTEDARPHWRQLLADPGAAPHWDDADEGAVERRLRTAAGAPRWFLLALQPPSGGGGCAICIATDIDRIKQRELALQRRASMQGDMLDVSVDCIKLIDLEGRVLHMNRAGCIALGVSGTAGFGMTWLPLLPADVHEAGQAALAVARSGGTGRFPGRSLMPDGSQQHWDNLLTPVHDSRGQLTGILCVSREVTAEREAIRALRESEERLSIAAQVGGLGIWDYDIVADRLHCDASWYRIMGRDAAQPVSSIDDFRPLIHPEDVDRATEVMNRATELLTTGEDYSIAFRIVRPDGEVRWIRSLAAVEHRDGRPTRAVGYVADVTDSMGAELALRDANRALLQETVALAREVLEDPLTGIANRRRLDAELPRLHAHAREHGQAPCIALVDVDHFKQYNDLYGHPAGDAALRRVAKALHETARHSDLVARYGGEEFAVVLPDTPDPRPLLDKFMAAIAALEIAHQGSPTGRLTISCGTVSAARACLTMPQLFKLSDEALYEAKHSGRNRYVARSAGEG